MQFNSFVYEYNLTKFGVTMVEYFSYISLLFRRDSQLFPYGRHITFPYG